MIKNDSFIGGSLNFIQCGAMANLQNRKFHMLSIFLMAWFYGFCGPSRDGPVMVHSCEL